jgi:hypothetical protein
MVNFAQTIDIKEEKVIYQLPYPGLLPDHPLYGIKTIRDWIVAFFNRDPLKKADIYLLTSDKKAAMALALMKKGKYQLAITTLSKGEKYFLKIPQLIKAAEKQGVSPSSELIEKLKTANLKHKEVIDEILKEGPKGLLPQIEALYQLNSQINQELSRLQMLKGKNSVVKSTNSDQKNQLVELKKR